MSIQPISLLAAAFALALGLALQAAVRAARAGRARDRLRGEGPAGPPAWFVDVLVALELPVAADAAWPWAGRAAAVAALALAVRAPVLAAAGLGAVTLGVAAQRSRVRRAADRGLQRALPGLLDDVVAAMASGSSLLQGFEVAAGRPGPAAAELHVALRFQARGIGLQEVVDRWAGQRPGTGLPLVADALALAGASGGSQVAALRSVGATLLERDALDREVRALAAQAQLSALVLVVTPAAFAAAVAVLDHRIAVFLLASPLGWACLVGGLLLDGAGAWWMRRLVGAVA